MILTEDQLQAFGEAVGRRVAGPVFFALRGELGAGKSVFARAVARGAGVQGTLPSPTFNLRFDYPLAEGGRVVHMDLYRLSEADEVWELGWEELGTLREIALVEWPGRAEPFLPPDRWEVALTPVADRPSSRLLQVTARGDPRPIPELADAVRSAPPSSRP